MRAIISIATTRYSKLLFSKPNNRHIKTIVPSIIRNIMSESDHQSPAFTSPKMVVKKVLAKSQSEGDGATVRRAIGRFGSWFFAHFIFFFIFPLLCFGISFPRFYLCVLKFSTSGFSLLCGLILFLGHLIFSRDLRNLDPFLMLDDFSGILCT